jgi:hypothetical protein
VKYEAHWLEYHAPRDEYGEIIDAPDNWFVQENEYCVSSRPDPSENDGWHELEMRMEFEADTIAIAHDRVGQVQEGSDVYDLTDEAGNRYTEEDA